MHLAPRGALVPKRAIGLSRGTLRPNTRAITIHTSIEINSSSRPNSDLEPGGQVHTQTVPMEDVGQSWLADECYATSPDEKEEEKIVLAMGPRPYPNPQKVVPSVEVQGRVSARATI
jgi:hypothetical protein